MDTFSEKQLATVYPPLAELVRGAASFLEPEGTFLCVYEGTRTAGQQQALYAQGRTAPGHVVTNAKAGYSNHNYGLAVDVMPYRSGQSGAMNSSVETPQYKAMVAALKLKGLEWGGDWKSFPDMDHFQMGGLPASPSAEMVADYHALQNSGVTLDGIWANFAAGKYT